MSTTIITGINYLDIKPGTICVVVRALSDPNEIGTELLRTNNADFPFVKIKTGDLWGSSLSGYSFRFVNL